MKKYLFVMLPLATVALSGCGVILNGVETLSDTVQTLTDITSTTSGALGDEEDSASEFVANNYDTLSEEAARGGGQSVEALAELLGEQDSDEFARWLQMHYDEVFSDAAGALDRIQFGRQQIAAYSL